MVEELKPGQEFADWKAPDTTPGVDAAAEMRAKYREKLAKGEDPVAETIDLSNVTEHSSDARIGKDGTIYRDEVSDGESSNVRIDEYGMIHSGDNTDSENEYSAQTEIKDGKLTITDIVDKDGNSVPDSPQSSQYFGSTESKDGRLVLTDIVDQQGQSIPDSGSNKYSANTEMRDGKLTITDIMDEKGNSVPDSK